MTRSRSALPPLQGLLVLLTGEGLARLVSFVAVWLLTQRLGREAYAPVAVVLAAMMFAALLVEMGFPLFGAREVARDPAAASRLLPPALATQLVVAALLVVVATAVAQLGLVAPEIARLLPGFAASLLFLPLLVPWIFQGFAAMHWVALPGLLRQLLFLLVSSLLVRSAAEVGQLPWAEVTAVAGAALVAQIALHRRGVRVGVDWRSAFSRELLREAVPMGSSQFLWVLRMYLATLCLWKLVPRESVSHYDVAHRVMMVLQALLTMYFTNLYPSLARAVRGPRAALVKLLVKSTLLAGAGTLLVACVTSAQALPLLTRLFPKGDYANPESASCLALLAFVIPVLACRGHARMTLLAMGKGRLELLCSIAGTLLLAILIPWWTTARGPSGAALALLAAELAGALLTFVALAVVLRTTSFGGDEAKGEVKG